MIVNLPKTKAALCTRVHEEALLDQELRSVMTWKQLEAWDRANDASMARVREAFYRDCQEQNIPNSRDHCNIVTMHQLKVWCGMEEPKTFDKPSDNVGNDDVGWDEQGQGNLIRNLIHNR